MERQEPEVFARRRLELKCIHSLTCQEKEPGFLLSGEAHAAAELIYVDQGRLHSAADGVELLLEQGDMMLYGPHQWHMQYADMEQTPRLVSICFETENRDFSRLFGRKLRAPQRCVELLQQILSEQARMDPFSGDMIFSLLSQLLLTLLREAHLPCGKLQAVNAFHNENQIILRTQQFITAHIRQKLSVPLVARMVDVSPSYLTALFQKHLQLSPGEYIRRAKLQESKRLIRESNMNFTQIAAALQYSTVHHFSRQFKEKFGITPSEYAKSVR